MSDPFIGEIRVLPYTYAPMGWLRCMGQSLAVSQYQALFAVIGYTYGGSGATFKLPDLSGTAVIGAGAGVGLTPRPIGASGGANAVTLNASQIPPHTHTLNTCNLTGTSTSPANLYVGHYAANRIYKENPDPATLVAMSANSLTAAGSSAAHENRQPALALPFCIAIEGIFPARS